MLRQFLVLVCLGAMLFAKTPRPLPNVPIHNPDFSIIDLKKYKGHPMVLVIFGTNCDDCVAVVHLMDKIQKDYGPQGLQVIGAAGDDKAKFMVGAFIARYRPSFPIGFISKEEIIKLADLAKDSRPVAPILLFIDKWGMVRQQFQGNDPIFKDAERSLKSLSLAMIKVQPVAPSQSK